MVFGTLFDCCCCCPREANYNNINKNNKNEVSGQPNQQGDTFTCSDIPPQQMNKCNLVQHQPVFQQKHVKLQPVASYPVPQKQLDYMYSESDQTKSMSISAPAQVTASTSTYENTSGALLSEVAGAAPSQLLETHRRRLLSAPKMSLLPDTTNSTLTAFSGDSSTATDTAVVAASSVAVAGKVHLQAESSDNIQSTVFNHCDSPNAAYPASCSVDDLSSGENSTYVAGKWRKSRERDPLSASMDNSNNSRINYKTMCYETE